MKPTVYIETTIPSYYCDNRLDLTADIARTRQWWDNERDHYECFISEVVLSELAEGNYRSREDCLDLVQGVSELSLIAEIEQIANVYQSRGLMPRFPVRECTASGDWRVLPDGFPANLELQALG